MKPGLRAVQAQKLLGFLSRASQQPHSIVFFTITISILIYWDFPYFSPLLCYNIFKRGFFFATFYPARKGMLPNYFRTLWKLIDKWETTCNIPSVRTVYPKCKYEHSWRLMRKFQCLERFTLSSRQVDQLIFRIFQACFRAFL